MLQENTWTDPESESSECAPAVLPPSAPRLTAPASTCPRPSAPSLRPALSTPPHRAVPARRPSAPSQRPASPPPSQRPASSATHLNASARFDKVILHSCHLFIVGSGSGEMHHSAKNCFYCWRIANHVVGKRKEMSKKLNLRVGSSMADARTKKWVGK